MVNKGTDIGDIHAPVEDTDVPFMLKFLVVLMLAGVIGLLVWLILSSAAVGGV